MRDNLPVRAHFGDDRAHWLNDHDRVGRSLDPRIEPPSVKQQPRALDTVEKWHFDVIAKLRCVEGIAVGR